MRRHIIKYFISLIAVTLPLHVIAESFVVDGICYEINSDNNDFVSVVSNPDGYKACVL